MIKKVKTKNLKPGVYIHDYNCDVSEENIFIEQAVIKDPKIIDILHSWGIEEVYIDTDRGLDVTSRKDKKSSPNISGTVLEKKQQSPTQPSSPELQSLKKEIFQAREIKDEALDLMDSSMQRLKNGITPNFEKSFDLVRKMQESLERNSDALQLLTRIRQKDEYTLYHSVSVSSLMLGMCQYKNMPKTQSLNFAVGALFHDIGKTVIKDEILNKPGKLTDEEYEHMKLHANKSAELLRSAEGLPEESFEIAMHHHERIDGSGYPHGLKGHEISYGAQLAAVCDIYDAVTSDRCYKQGIGAVSGLALLYKLAGDHLNEEIVYDFIRFLGVYPVGSCVRLDNGLVGVVICSTDNQVEPILKIIADLKRKKKLSPYTLELTESTSVIEGYEDPERFGLTQNFILKLISSDKNRRDYISI